MLCEAKDLYFYVKNVIQEHCIENQDVTYLLCIINFNFLIQPNLATVNTV